MKNRITNKSYKYQTQVTFCQVERSRDKTKQHQKITMLALLIQAKSRLSRY